MQHFDNKGLDTFLQPKNDLGPKMTSLQWSKILDGVHDSGIDSINISSLNVHTNEVQDGIISLENNFNKMQIDNGFETGCHDSGLYPSRQYVSNDSSSETYSIETVWERQCVAENIKEENCEDIESDYRKEFHITMAQVIRLYEGDKDGDNTLNISIINGHAALSRLLINIVPDYDWLNYSNHLRQTPLHLAVITHQPIIVRSLVRAGVIVMAQDQHGDTPLHIACRLGYTDIVKLLLRPVKFGKGLENRCIIPFQRVPQDLTARNYEGHTCLHLASRTGHRKVVHMLLEAGADINSGDSKSGRTVLHVAADMGDSDMVQFLLCCDNININKQDYAGLTPLQLACGRMYANIVNIICAFNGQDIATAYD